MWAMQPVVVGEYPDPGSADGGEVLFADRSQAVHRCRAEIFQEARGRIQKDRYQMITLEAPDPGRLPEAVRAGIQDAVLLFFEKPPKGSGNNFGYKALTRLSADVASIKGKSAWDKLMPDPRMRLAGRMSALNYGHYFWKDGSADADRGLFADFLDQAAVILENDGIRSVAGQYRNIADKWQSLAELWLPRELPLCADAADSIDGPPSQLPGKRGRGRHRTGRLRYPAPAGAGKGGIRGTQSRETEGFCGGDLRIAAGNPRRGS
jgi:hypothetical protein